MDIPYGPSCPRMLLCGLLPVCICLAPAYADDTASTVQEPPPKLTINDWFTPRYNGIDNSQGNLVVLRAYVPWNLFGASQLTRFSVPITTAAAAKGIPDGGLIDDFPSGPEGLGDTEVYDVAQFNLGGMVLSAGPVFLLPTGTESGVGAGKITAGPAWGLKTKAGRWSVGIFSLSYFSIGGHTAFPSTAKSKLQPIVNLTLSDGWDIGTSDMNFTYDWNKDRYSNIPLGVALGKSFALWGRNFKVVQQAEYNFADTPHTSAWTLRFTLEIPLPELN